MTSESQDRQERETKRKRDLRDDGKQAKGEHQVLSLRIFMPESGLVLPALTNSGTRYGEWLEFLQEIESEARVPSFEALAATRCSSACYSPAGWLLQRLVGSDLLARLSTVPAINCWTCFMVRTWLYKNSVGLLGEVSGGRREVGAFGTTISVGPMVLAIE